MTDENTIVHTAVYDDRDAALADLETLGQLHDEQLLGNYDAAVIDRENGAPHIVKRADRPSHRVAPELIGRGTLPRPELHEAAAELTEGEAGLIVVAEPTLEKAFDTAADDPFKS